jgi:predicted transcriptional regulator
VKSPVGYNVDRGVTQRLRERAEAIGVSQSVLAEMFLTDAMARWTDDALHAWAAKQPNIRGRLGGGLTKNELALLQAFTRLLAPGEAFRFELAQLASEAGLLRKDAYNGLKALQNRGRVSGAESEERDRWERPVESFWRLL